MGKHTLTILVIGSLVLGLNARGEETKEQDEAVAAIEKLGGKVEVDANRPGKHAIAVKLTGDKVTDTDLVHLKPLTELQRLDLFATKVRGDGLKNLSGLTQLRYLSLHSSEVTDEGLPHLKELKQLRTLDLRYTEV